MHLSIYYSNEIKIAFSNAGNYWLKIQYLQYKIDRSFIHTHENNWWIMVKSKKIC